MILSNHLSYYDPVLIGGPFGRPMRFMAKKELFENKLFGFLLSRLGAFPVERGAGDQNALHKAVSIVTEGGVLLIFPEGGRSKTGELLRFKSGAMIVATKAGAPVVPCGIVMREGKKFRSLVEVHFGSVILPEQLDVVANDLRSLKIASGAIRQQVEQLIAKK